MLTKTISSAVQGVDARSVTVEASVGPGIKMSMVGLPDNAVRESIDRIKTAIQHNQYAWPKGRMVINLAPANLRKEGSGHDLALAIAIMATNQQVEKSELDRYMIMGELSLDGSLQPVKGALPIAMHARKKGMKGFLLPVQNASEAAIVKDLEIVPVHNLKDAVKFLNGKKHISPLVKDTRSIFAAAQRSGDEDFADVKGQKTAKRALEVAAAGGHNMVMVGPPGSGKTMLAKRLRGILPPMNLYEALETTKIHSVAGLLGTEACLMAKRPFRSPHHTISDVALVGGGSHPQPGEISLAHNGVLFMDELPEFRRSVLEVMRQPLEDRKVTVSRARFSVEFPTNFMLVASMNPCPCGNYTNPDRTCTCSPKQIRRYLGRVSGPLMDRIDLQIEVPPVQYADLASEKREESSADIRARVVQARKTQLKRFQDFPLVHSNSMMSSALVREYCQIKAEGLLLLKSAIEHLGLSARAYDRILKVARTIADLEGAKDIQSPHVAEAISYRNLDRSNWA